MVDDWSEVTPGRTSRNSNNLEYGQVKILTPSRFSKLLEVDEKGDRINPIKIEEEIVEKSKEGKNEEKNEIQSLDERSDTRDKKEVSKAEESQNQGIAGI